jgi:hypothetical protein
MTWNPSPRDKTPDVLVCPSCQAYNLPDATRCFLCGRDLHVRGFGKIPQEPPPLFDPDLDEAPFPMPRRPRVERRPTATKPRMEPPPDPANRLALGLVLAVLFLGLLRLSPILALLAAFFLGPPILRALGNRSRGDTQPAGPLPRLAVFLGSTLLALAAVAFVFLIAVFTVIITVLKAIFD